MLILESCRWKDLAGWKTAHCDGLIILNGVDNCQILEAAGLLRNCDVHTSQGYQ